MQRWSRYLLIAALVLLLLLAGVYDELVFAGLTKVWHTVLSTVGMEKIANALQSGVHQGVTHRPLLAGISYAGLYTGTCLVLLRLLLPRPEQWTVVLRIYGGIFLAYVVLVLVGKVGGNLLWAYLLSRHLLDFLVSPLPVIALLALLRGTRSAL
jgi:hypothetical protein